LQKKLETRNWIILGIFLVVSLIFMPYRFTLGILLGGLISIINFYWLSRGLQKVFRQFLGRARSSIVIRYYIRITVTGVALFFIITRTPADVIGLLIGLSVVVVNTISTVLLEFSKKNYAKEVE
jgi:ATP synthase I chain.